MASPAQEPVSDEAVANFDAASPLSALIRTYNSGEKLEACLKSLEAQTLPPRQIVVVDSGSTDRTLAIARSHGCDILSYPRDTSFHYSRAINLGMQQVMHPMALIVSSHVCLPIPSTLEVMRTLLVDNPDACAASICRVVHPRDGQGDACVGLTEHLDWRCVTHSDFLEEYATGAISNSCNLIRKRDWMEKKFSEEIPRCEDQEWLVYFLRRGRTAARILSPPIIYDNPYYTDEKKVLDSITMAQYGISPSLTKRGYLIDLARQALLAVRHRHWARARRHGRLLFGLLCVKIGLGRRMPSGYA